MISRACRPSARNKKKCFLLNFIYFYRLRSNGIGNTIQNERLGYFSHQGQTKNGRKVYVREQNGQQNQYLYFWDWGPNNGANWFIGLDPQLKPRGNKTKIF